MFDGLPVRGILVRLTESWREVLARRGDASAWSAPVQRLLGEMAAAGVLMHANIKFAGDLILHQQPRAASARASSRDRLGCAG